MVHLARSITGSNLNSFYLPVRLFRKTDSCIDLIKDFFSSYRDTKRVHFYNEETARGNKLITEHEIIENKTSGDFSRELEKTETREVREAYVASQIDISRLRLTFHLMTVRTLGGQTRHERAAEIEPIRTRISIFCQFYQN